MTTLRIEPADLAPLRATLQAHYDNVLDCARREADQGTNLGHLDAAHLDAEAEAVLCCITVSPDAGPLLALVEDADTLRYVLDTQTPKDLEAGDADSLARVAASVAVLRQLL